VNEKRRPGTGAAPNPNTTNGSHHNPAAHAAPVAEQIVLPKRCSGCGRRSDRCDCARLDALALELHRLLDGAPS
jgi:hypothetical protein